MSTARMPTIEGSMLSGRELQVLGLLAQGLQYKEIGARLHIAAPTVKQHLSRIYSKLGAENGCHAVHLAWQSGYLRSG